MANAKAVKPVTPTIDLGDGVEREFNFSLNAMAELEIKYGSIEAAFKKIKDESSIQVIRYLLWLILVPDGEELTERQVGAMINVNNLNEIMNTLMDAFSEAMPNVPRSSGDDAPNITTPANW